MTTSQGGSTSSRRSMSSLTHSASHGRKKSLSAASDSGVGGVLDSPSRRKTLSASRSMGLSGERTVKRLRLSRALTIPETTSIKDACHRMASRRVDALLLTDSNALLCGILTDKDIATRVIAREINLEETPVSKVMTRNPVFVLSDTLAVEALQKMVQGKFRHLPVVENGEVIAILDITKCLYDAIARLERAAEKGKAIAAAVEGVEKHWGTSLSGSNTFMETLRERMFRPSLSTIVSENSKVAVVDPSDTILVAARKMLELDASCALVTVENRPLGILTPKDILMRVLAQNLPPESTLVQKVMTPNPQCATVDTPIVDALHTMHDGKFLHLPVVDGDGMIVTVIDVLHITHAAVATIGNTAGVSGESASTVLQNFWDSAMALPPDDEDETQSDISLKLQSEGGDTSLFVQRTSSAPTNTFAFKFQDKKGRMHRFICDAPTMADLMAAVLQRVGAEIDRNNFPQILYEDEDHDKVVLATDSDLQAAIYHARMAGWKGIRLHLDYLKTSPHQRRASIPGSFQYAHANALPPPSSSSSSSSSSSPAYSTVAAAGAALVALLGVYAFLRRARY